MSSSLLSTLKSARQRNIYVRKGQACALFSSNMVDEKTGAHSSFEIINDCDKSLNLVIAKIVFDVTSMTTQYIN